MAIIDIARGQQVRIPAIQLTNGREFAGSLKASDGETVVIELDNTLAGLLPDKVDDVCVLVWQNEGIQRACPIIVRSKSNHAIVGQVVIQERRESPRVRVDVQVAYQVIPAGKVKETAEEVLAHINTMTEPTSEGLALLRSGEDPLSQMRREMTLLREMVGEMILKLDDLTAIVVGGMPAQAPANRPRQPLVILNCSSTGIGFIANEKLQEGDYLRLHLSLRTVPKTEIECMGVVVRCTGLDGGAEENLRRRYDIGVHFTHIHENDREHLIHYLFKVQRRLLRDLKEARQALADKDTPAPADLEHTRS